MAASDKPSLSDKSRHFHIENHVTSDFLVPRQFLFYFLGCVSTSPFFECYPHPGHFFLNRRMPVVVVVVFVQIISLLDTLWQIDPNFMCRSPIPALDLGNYSLSLPQRLGHPPLEGWFSVDLGCHCVFRCLGRIGIFHLTYERIYR